MKPGYRPVTFILYKINLLPLWSAYMMHIPDVTQACSPAQFRLSYISRGFELLQEVERPV